jgi:NAD(P)H-nitrite reductase large subunit
LSFKYVIIGGSAGGIGAVEAIRGIDKTGSLAVVSEEPVPQYSKPMISEYISGGVSLEGMIYRPVKFWEESSVNLLSGRKAVMVDIPAREVVLEDNSKIHFEKLLIATGGKPILPKIDGINKRGVYTFTSLIDAQRLIDGLADAARVIIVGGGLIGVSLAKALVKLRKNTTIVELKDRILSLILDAEGSGLVARAIKQSGVNIVTGQSVIKILSRRDSESQVSGVLLDNGTELNCDLVVFAIGVTPRIDMIDPNQVKVNRGVVVDRSMATSASDVYACGDAAEAFDFTWEDSRLLPLWPLAYVGGRVAGSNMAGVKAEYPGGTQMSALNYFGLPVISVGVVNPPEDKTFEILSSLDREKRIYRKIVLRNNTVRGMILVGKIDNAGVIFDLLKNKVETSEFKDKILSEDFALIHLTESLRREMLWRS